LGAGLIQKHQTQDEQEQEQEQEQKQEQEQEEGLKDDCNQMTIAWLERTCLDRNKKLRS
jgi:hypothetical protein